MFGVMKKMRKLLIFPALLALFIVFIFSFTSCTSFRSSDEEVLERFENSPVPSTIGFEFHEGFQVRVLRVNPGAEKQVLFIHGAPGSIDDSRNFMMNPDLNSRAELIAYDRPGYGFTDFGKIETSIEKQAALARSLVDKGAIIVGHSFGATIALRMAMDYPEDFSQVIVLAGVSAAEHEKIWFFNYPMEWPVFNWMLGGAWKASNTEKLSHLQELPLMDELWKQVQGPILFIHGDKDSLVPVENSRYAMERLGHADARYIELEDENHFILWTQEEMILEEIFAKLD
jgi:pimeloyl-ACP methyl ester carboxylesterase